MEDGIKEVTGQGEGWVTFKLDEGLSLEGDDGWLDGDDDYSEEEANAKAEDSMDVRIRWEAPLSLFISLSFCHIALCLFSKVM